jgi:hypothetical protein
MAWLGELPLQILRYLGLAEDISRGTVPGGALDKMLRDFVALPTQAAVAQ